MRRGSLPWAVQYGPDQMAILQPQARGGFGPVCRVWSKEHRASFHVVTMFRMREGRIAEMDEV